MAEDTFALDVNDFKEESQQVDQDTTAKESSAEETKKPEVAEDAPQKDDVQEKETEEVKQDDTADQPDEPSDETEDSDKPQAKNAAQNRIRTLVAEKRDLEKRVNELTAQVYRPQTAEELVEGGMSPSDARVEALEQQMQLEKFNNHVVSLNSDLNAESQQVLHDFPVFDRDSKDYDPEFAAEVQEQYMRAAQIQTDPNTGMIVNAAVLPYDFYKFAAKARDRGRANGEVSGKKNATKELAAAEHPSGAAPKKESKDAFMEGFDSIK